MTPLLASAAIVVLLFILGEFFTVKGFGRRPSATSPAMKINIILLAAWLAGITIHFAGYPAGALLLLLLAVLWTISQMRTHWIPWLIGAPEEYREGYHKIFGGHSTILPRLTKRGVLPDAYHTFLFLFLLITIYYGVKSLGR